MKKLLLIFVFLLPAGIYAQDIIIDERITDIYFANGILTTEEEAWMSSDLIKDSAIKDIYNNNESSMDKEARYKLLYNESHGLFMDLLEALKQKKGDNRLFWFIADVVYDGACGYLKGGLKGAAMDIASGLLLELGLDPIQEKLEVTYITNLVDSIVGSITGDLCALPSTLGFVIDGFHDIDFTRQIADVRESVISGHHVMAVAHSQGNFFAKADASL